MVKATTNVALIMPAAPPTNATAADRRPQSVAVRLGFGVMGSSEVHATPSAAPPQPRLGKAPGRARPRSPSQPLQVTTGTL